MAAIIIFLIFGTLFGIVKCSRSSTSDGETSTEQTSSVKGLVQKVADKVHKEQKLKLSTKVTDYARQFNDLNDQHIAAAQKIGITPVGDSRDIMNINKPIVHIETCREYTVDNLTHSYPYLIEPASDLLREIGSRFNACLKGQGGGDYRIKVTSVLRTDESVGRLKRRNVNSTDNSAHLYATTFDISYVDFPQGHLNTRFHSDGELKNILASVLLELKEEGRCLVKHERKQGCFHITATGR